MWRAGETGLWKVLIFWTIIVCLNVETHGQDESKLFRDLLYANNNKLSRPTNNVSTPVPVTFILVLRKILDFDPKDQSISFAAWLQTVWKDYRLVWDPRSYGGVNVIQAPSKQLWMPDIELYNSIGPTELLVGTDAAVIRSDGTVINVPAKAFKASCPTNITDDVHRCTLIFGSWIHSASKLDLQFKSNAPLLKEYNPSHKWDLVGTSVKEEAKFFDCCPEPYKEVRYTLELRRNSDFTNSAWRHGCDWKFLVFLVVLWWKI